MLIYRCGPGALLLFMVLGASLRDRSSHSLYMCVVMCFSVSMRRTQNWCRAPSQCKSVTDSSCWIRFLNTRNSGHNYDKVMLSFFCGGPKPTPITMTTSALGTANLGPDRGRHWSGDAFPPQSAPNVCRIRWPLCAWWVKPYIKLYMSTWEYIRQMCRCCRLILLSSLLHIYILSRLLTTAFRIWVLF